MCQVFREIHVWNCWVGSKSLLSHNVFETNTFLLEPHALWVHRICSWSYWLACAFMDGPKIFRRAVVILSHLLTGQRFSQLKQTFVFSPHSDLKLHLQSTDYGSFLANEASPLTVSVIDDKLKEKMVVEFRHMRNQSYEPLASFMDFITWGISADLSKL